MLKCLGRGGFWGTKVLWQCFVVLIILSSAAWGQGSAQKDVASIQDSRVLSLDTLILYKDSILKDTERTVVNLSLAQCIQRSLEHNYDIRITSLDPKIRLSDVTSAEAVFDAILFSSAQFDLTDKDNIDSGFFTRTIETPGGIKEIRIPSDPFDNIHDYNYAIGIRQLLPTGTTVQLSQQLRRVNDLNDEDLLFRNPFFEYNLQLQVSQPLLRDFGLDVNLAATRAARDNYQISLQQLQLQMIQTMAQVEANYWSLFFTRQQVIILSRLLERARRTLDVVKARESFDSQISSLSRTEALIAKTNANLITVRNEVLSRQDILLESMNDPNLGLTEKWEIILTNCPTKQVHQVEYADAVETAKQFRPEIIAQRFGIDISKLVLDVADNQRLPRLDVIYQQDVSGAGNSYNSAWDQQWQNDKVSYGVSLSFEFPVGNRAREAEYRKAQDQKEQEELRLNKIVEEVLSDLNISINTLANTYKEVDARRLSVKADEHEVRYYMVIQDNEGQNTMTPDFLNLKLNADERLANSQISAVQTMVEYEIAIMNLYRSQGTLIRHNNIKLDEEVDTTLPQSAEVEAL